MGSERKLLRMEKKLSQLEEENAKLRSKNTALEIENQSLQKRCDTAENAVTKMKTVYDEAMEEQKRAVEDAVDAMNTYKELAQECRKLKRKYTKQADSLICEIQKTGDRLAVTRRE